MMRKEREYFHISTFSKRNTNAKAKLSMIKSGQQKEKYTDNMFTYQA